MKKYLILFYFLIITPYFAIGSTRYATYLFPKDLLFNYNPLQDPTYLYYSNILPISKKVSRTDIYQTSIQRVMGILNYDSRSEMNPKIIGTVLNGRDRSLFEGWNYIDVYVSFAGDSLSGVISVPTPQEITVGHKNGVPVLGSLMFPSSAYGGNIQWEKDLLLRDSSGKYLAIEKLANLAKMFHFDGWFFNLETDNSSLTSVEVNSYLEIVNELKKQGLHIIWHDSLTQDGQILYQNGLNNSNKIFLDNSSFFFTNYDWRTDELIASQFTAGNRAQDVYMGVNWWDDNFNSIRRIQSLISFNEENKYSITHLSLGLWAIEFPIGYNTEKLGIDQIHQNFSEKWWPSDFYHKNLNFKTIGDMLTPKTSITKLPFISNFNLGKGFYFYRNGKVDTTHATNWGNLFFQDYLPPYIFQKDNIFADYDFTKAWFGGSSYVLKSKNFKGMFPIYYTWIPHSKKVKFNIIYQSNQNVKAYIKRSDGLYKTMDLPAEVNWKNREFNLDLHNSTISEMGVIVNSNTKIYLGQISIQ